MKIVAIRGGLGNQIFTYAYWMWLKNKFPQETIYAFYPKVDLKLHNGLEIFDRFNVQEPPTNKWITILANSIFFIGRVCVKLGLKRPFTCVDNEPFNNKTLYWGVWMDKKYYSRRLNLPFRKLKITDKNVELIELIKKEKSVCIHVRRGDFLKPVNAEIVSGICTDIYYINAIEEIKKQEEHPFYIFFSDDPDYIRQHFHLPNMTVVDWNTREDSFIDMYLMSKCKYMIIANSTFSYWAAMFNKSAYKIYCPTKWTKNLGHDILQDDWIKIKS